MPTCKHCSSAFEITKDDLAFYAKVSPEFAAKKQLIPAPMLCPDCRLQSRMCFRNERALYHRKCDLSGKQMISIYSPDKPYKVYDQEVWWSDVYDPLAYGREFDFSRSFFAQFNELHLAVPKSAIQNAKSINCAYTNYSAENKDCYLLVGGLGDKDCLYCYRVIYSTDIVDGYDLYRCERCYECSESSDLYGSSYCQNCHNCHDLFLCEDCIGCRDCLGCCGLRNQSFHINNVPYPEAEYRKRIAELRKNLPAARAAFQATRLKVPHRFAHIIQCEDSSGNQLLQCKRCVDCYSLKHSEDCAHSRVAESDRDCQDINFGDNCELQYCSTNLEKNYGCTFNVLVWYCKDTHYCMNSFNSNNLFGCSGMKKHSYCILNKQYSKEEYEQLVPKIIEKMKSDGEWGRFFPGSISPFGYNETVAQEYFPLDQQQAKKENWKWHAETAADKNYLGPKIDVPADITKVDDSITSAILLCEKTGKPYKIIPQELKFYRDTNTPIPRLSPDERHRQRMAALNPRKLWNRECMKCKKAIQTTYAPERSEIVYCEACYLSTVY
jgi:hypothetical protein